MSEVSSNNEKITPQCRNIPYAPQDKQHVIKLNVKTYFHWKQDK